MAEYKDMTNYRELFDEEYKKTRKLISQGETYLDNLAEGFMEADMVIRKIPAADVVEVRRGEWIYHGCVSSYDGAISGYSCSCCCVFIEEDVYENTSFPNNFCPKCGADMRGEG